MIYYDLLDYDISWQCQKDRKDKTINNYIYITLYIYVYITELHVLFTIEGHKFGFVSSLLFRWVTQGSAGGIVFNTGDEYCNYAGEIPI